MKKSLGVIFVVLMCVSSVETMEPTYYTYLLPVVTRTTGAAGSFWSTEVCFTNLDWRDQSPILVELYFIKNNSITYSDFRLNDYQTLCTPDIVDAVLGVNKWTGTLLIVTNSYGSWNPTLGERDRFLVTAKVTNNTDNGTYGLNISPEIDHFGQSPIHWYSSASDNDDFVDAWVNGVKNFGTPGVSGYRSSIGFANLSMGIDGWDGSPVPIYQDISFVVLDRRGNGVFLYETTTIPPFTQRQIALPSDLDIDKGSVLFSILGEPDTLAYEAAEGVFPYLTVTDNQTGDGVYIPFKVMASSGPFTKQSGEETFSNRLIKYLRKQPIRRAPKQLEE